MKIRLLSLVAGVLLTSGAAASAAPASSSSDADDNLSPASTAFTTDPNSAVVFSFTVNNVAAEDICGGFTADGSTQASGLGLTLGSRPTIGACTVNQNIPVSGTFSGTWQILFRDKPVDEARSEPGGGDRINFRVPKAGITLDLSNFAPGCTVTISPNGSSTIFGTYTDEGFVRFQGSAPESSTGCTTNGTATFSGGMALSVRIVDVG
jgi:hypothetical protein